MSILDNLAGLMGKTLLGPAQFMVTKGLVAPIAPTGLTATQNGADVDLAWTDNATNETEYRIYRSSDGVTYSLIDTIAADSTSYTDTAPGWGTWYYKVAAANGSGEALSDAVAIYSLAQNLITSAGTLREDFENSADWGAVLGAVANDVVNYKTGTQSVKLTSPVGGEARMQKDVTSWDLSADNIIRFWFYVVDADNIGAASLYVRLYDTTGTKYFQNYLYFHTGWNLVQLEQSDWTASGGMTWSSAVRYLRFVFNGDTGVQGVISFDALYSGPTMQPAIAITFDDGLSSAYSMAFPYMNTRQMRGTAYIISGSIGNAGFMTAAQLLEMHNSGWTIGNHSDATGTMVGLTQGQVETRLQTCQTALEGIGITGNGPKHVAYPSGGYDANVLAAMANLSYYTGRTVDPARYEALPLDRPYQVDRGLNLGNTTSLATAKAYVDAVKSGGEIGVIVAHDIIAGSPSTTEEWNISDFQALCDYIISNKVPTVTIDEAYRLQSGTVSVPIGW